MSDFVVGALGDAVLWGVVEYSRRRNLHLAWWQWLLTVMAIVYWVLTALLAIGFLAEGAPQAALVMGLILGVPGVLFYALLLRFVFNRVGS